MTQTGDQPWSVWRITAVLFPMGGGAMAVNVFFFSLILSWMGVGGFPPIHSL